MLRVRSISSSNVLALLSMITLTLFELSTVPSGLNSLLRLTVSIAFMSNMNSFFIFDIGFVLMNSSKTMYSTSEKSIPLNLPKVDSAPAYPIISGFSSSSLSVMTAISLITFNCMLVPKSALIALKGLLTGEQQFSTSTSLLLR